MFKYLVLAAFIAAGASQATGWVYTGATAKAAETSSCISTILGGNGCQRAHTGAKFVTNEHFKGE